MRVVPEDLKAVFSLAGREWDSNYFVSKFWITFSLFCTNIILYIYILLKFKRGENEINSDIFSPHLFHLLRLYSDIFTV